MSRLGAVRAGFAFRGQDNIKWELASSAFHRIQRHRVYDPLNLDLDPIEGLIQYHRQELLRPARTAGFGVANGRNLSDLELLAQLQHLGAATALLDFTWNPLIALWFACQPTDGLTFKRNKEDESPGMVFAVNLHNKQGFDRIGHEPVRQRVPFADLLCRKPLGKPLYWEPIVQGCANARIMAQYSVFVIGRPTIPCNLVNKIEVEADKKELLLGELKDYIGVEDSHLFRDLPGFSSANGRKWPIRRSFHAETEFQKAQYKHQATKEEEAIEYYNRCLEKENDVGEVYFFRANAKAALGDHEGACEDYDKAEPCTRLLWVSSNAGRSKDADFKRAVNFNRANSKFMMGYFEEALQDLMVADEASGTGYWHAPIRFNRANVFARLHRLKKAASDFEFVIRHAGSRNDELVEHAHFNLGNALVMLGRLDDAKTAFTGTPSGYAGSNAECVDRVLKHIGKAKVLDAQTVPSTSTKNRLAPLGEVHLSIKGKKPLAEPVSFTGNVGNAGNFPHCGGNRLGLPAGERLPGESNYVVLVKGEG